MAPHADTLDRPEPMAVPFWTSVVVHLVVIGGFSASALLQNAFHIQMGSPTGGGIGSVQVTPVANIPLPNRGGPQNPVANDTQSQVPTPPTPKQKTKAIPKPKTPSPAAIALKNEKTEKPSRQPEAQAPNKFRDQQQYAENQLYTAGGQRLSSQVFNIQGGGSTSLGDNSPFGQEFGAYAKIIRENIGSKWNPAALNLRAGARFVVMTFTIRRDGSVTNVRVKQSSGITSMDYSAERAVNDAHLPSLPPNFPHSQADVELRFELGN